MGMTLKFHFISNITYIIWSIFRIICRKFSNIFLVNCLQGPVNCSASTMEASVLLTSLTIFLWDLSVTNVYASVYISYNWLNTYAVLRQDSVTFTYALLAVWPIVNISIADLFVNLDMSRSCRCFSVNKITKYQTV